MKKFTTLHYLRMLILTFVLFMASLPVLKADSAPSMNFGFSTNQQAIVKMQRAKVLQSAQYSFYELMNFTGGYTGLQQTGANLSNGSIMIFSAWDPNTSAGIYSEVEYVSPITTPSRFGGEGDGYKTMTDYRWSLNQWYTITLRSWLSGGKLYIAAYILNDATSEWFQTATLSAVNRTNLGNGNNSFIENWSSNGQFPRKVLYKDFFSMAENGSWEKPYQTHVSCNDSEHDKNRNGIYHDSFNAYYDSEEDAFCLEHGKGVTPGSHFGGKRTANLGAQLQQADQPELTVGAVKNLTAASEYGRTVVNWEVDNKKSPQFSVSIKIMDAGGAVVAEAADTIPHLRTLTLDNSLEPGDYTLSLEMTDIFNQKAEPLTTGFVVADEQYMLINDTKFALPSTANSYKSFDIRSNVNWTVSADQPWLSFDRTEGEGNATVQLIVEENSDEAAARSATITIAAEGVDSHQITLTQSKKEEWFYVFNQRGWKNGAPLLTNTLTGVLQGEELTAHPAEQNNYWQQWKIEYDESGNYMQLINRMTGLSIDAQCRANDPEDAYMWKLQAASGSTKFPGYRIISKDGRVGIHAQYSRVFPYNYEVAECFWYFISPEELYDFEPLTYSAINHYTWYNIYTPGYANQNYLTDKGLDAIVKGENLQENNEAQQWCLMDKGDGSVEIVSRKSMGNIQVPDRDRVGVRLTTDGSSWKLNYQQDNMFQIVNGSFELNMTAARSAMTAPGKTPGDAASWIFQKADAGTSVKDVADDGVRVYVQHSRLIVTGTNEIPLVFNLSGQQVSTNTELRQGVYFVIVQDKTHKILVR